MDQILTTVIPVFGLIGLGYAIARLGVLGAGAGEALSAFVFNIAIPVLMFRVLGTADLSAGTAWELWLAYYIAFTLAWIVGAGIVRRVFGRDARAGLVAGISGAYSNALLVGIPLVSAAYGAEGMAAISLLITVHLPILMLVSAILIERALVADGLATDADWSTIARSLARGLVLNPVVIGLVAGIVWRLAGLPLGGAPRVFVDRIADTAGTLALISVGMGLSKYGISRNVPQGLAVGFVKLVLMPAMLLAVVLWVIPLPPVWAKALVIAAACPTGVNAYVVAARFGTGEALASNAITLTTALAVVTVSVWLQVLAAVF